MLIMLFNKSVTNEIDEEEDAPVEDTTSTAVMINCE